MEEEPKHPGDDIRARRLQRAKHLFLALARRVEANPDRTGSLSTALGERLSEYWEPVIEAAMQAAESLGYESIHPSIDEAMARSLREKPDLALISEIYNRIPLDTLLLRQTSLEVFRQTVRAMEERNRVDLHPAEYLTMWLNYISRLIQVANLNEAESEVLNARDFVRKKFREDPVKFGSGLAETLETYAVVANAKGLYDNGREAREEAIGILRGISGHEKQLAQCLNNYAGTLNILGEKNLALEISREAVAIYRKLVESKTSATETSYSSGLQAWVDDPRPNLGDALIALSTYQNEAKLYEECLVSAKEAYDIFFELSEDFPDQFRYHLGMAQHNLGMAKTSAGDIPGGLMDFRESAKIYKTLYDIHPEVFAPDYAHILGSLALACLKDKKIEEALAPAEECVSLLRKLDEQIPGRFTRQLARNFDYLSLIYAEMGWQERSIQITEELERLKTRER